MGRPGTPRTMLLMAAIAVWLPLAVDEAEASFCGALLYSVSPDNSLLSQHDPFGGFLLGETPMSLPGETIVSATGIAGNWDTEELFVLLDLAGHAGSQLGIVDPQTAEVIPIGNTGGLRFADVAVDWTGALYAVTDEAESPPESLYELDPFDGTPTFICSLGRGDDGEAITFGWWDDVLFHASGSMGLYDPGTDIGVIFESLPIFDADPCDFTDIPIEVELTSGTCAALVFLPWGTLAWKLGEGPGPIYHVDPYSGAIVDFGFSPVAVSGLATLLDCSGLPFQRGDSNDDGSANIADAVSVILWLFDFGFEPACQDAADVNDDGQVNIADPIYLLNYLLVPGSPPPPPPSGFCDVDPTPDDLTCDIYQSCF